MSRRCIDLNADVGEASEEGAIRVERALLGLVTSAHVACGGHAGDQASMHATVEAALGHGVRIGAHPSYPDRTGFGRRPMEMDAGALTATLRRQLEALALVCSSAGTTVASVKAHGALYGEVARGGPALTALLDAWRSVCAPGTVLVLRAGSPAVELARRGGVGVLEEAFCDRAYASTGGLLERRVAGSVLSDPDMAARQAVSLARDGRVATADGAPLALRVDTLCIHGDTPGAPAMAAAVRRALVDCGMEVVAPPPAA
ncbi:MAG TPA: 5-oxoprolinase subunit PxpA [Acidimicrobiales bacterium]|nr:5-oxoprolinase subunit PxpA [Acidimicrobiales bacterium]